MLKWLNIGTKGTAMIVICLLIYTCALRICSDINPAAAFNVAIGAGILIMWFVNFVELNWKEE